MSEQALKFATAKIAKEKGFEFLPTQSILQKWLREVHKLEVNAYGVRGATNVTYYTYSVNEVSQLHPYKCTTYEEALEAGLFDALMKL